MPIDRRDRVQSDQAIALAVERMREGRSFIVFPEGHAEPDRGAAAVQEGRLHPGHPGAGADRAGGHHRHRAGDAPWKPPDLAGRDSTCDSVQPVPTAGLTYDDRDRLMDDVRDRIQALLAREDRVIELLALLGRTLAFSFACGINLYATVAILGLARHFDWVDLPPQFAVFDNPWVIGIAGVLFLVEFVADKIPWLDTVWDGIHTAVRPLGGALVAVATLGEADPVMQGAVALLGGVTAGSSHFAKAGTRAMVNASPEPFSNWFISLVEDVLVLGLATVALQSPAGGARRVLRPLRGHRAVGRPDRARDQAPPSSRPPAPDAGVGSTGPSGSADDAGSNPILPSRTSTSRAWPPRRRSR